MTKQNIYNPPFTITSAILHLIADISEAVGRISVQTNDVLDLRLRRLNRIRTIQGSLAIEGNTLSEEQITAILDGQHVIAPPREIQEARNAILAYDHLEQWNPKQEKDLLQAHNILMAGLLDDHGKHRQGGVGVMSGSKVLHMAPPPARVPFLMGDLFQWLQTTEHHPLISSSVFHYEFEFIHPFADGNGRIGRLWQTLILFHWNPIFLRIPVESLVYAHQQDYYKALQQSTNQGEVTPFLEFMLSMIRDAVLSITPQVNPQVTPQVAQILQILSNAHPKNLSRKELQDIAGLRDRKSFSENWIKPALNAKLIEMTLPDKPNSRLQCYRLTNKGNFFVERIKE
ncbi:Fic family protein [Desulfovibrio litoralis]|uniref:Fic family protein n=1 Tax=Desulfovibrio litoralis DSM 11393 TaxID=1121455 RepID=A0A1M7T9U7_9BACT|nr:Fic family protein [Desulfovibrio litoralis]SHN67504.1 Fic family protein [Desulfovibrio litoralis DSM 11393]